MMSERAPRRRTFPIKQQTLDTVPEDFRVSFSVSTSTVDTLAAIYLNEYHLESPETQTSLTPQQLFQSFRGQQLHVLNELMIMVIREVKRFYIKVNADFKPQELSIEDVLLPVTLNLPPRLIKSYFPSMTPDEVETWSGIIMSRIEEYPDIEPGSATYLKMQVGKKRLRKVKAIDIPQLVFDIWNDWRFNQAFTIKRGVLPNAKQNANYFEMADKLLQTTTQIWNDQLATKEGEIELDAIEMLAAWRVLLSNPKLWKSIHAHTLEVSEVDTEVLLVEHLLDLQNQLRFEQLINIRYLLDETVDTIETDAILSAYISGQPDIIVLIPTGDGGIRTLLIDIKTTLRNTESLETLITKLQAKVAAWVKPSSKSPAVMMASELSDADLSEYEVIHINPLSIIQLAAGRYDFEAVKQQTFNSFQDRVVFQAIIQDAALHPKKYKDRILRHKRQNRVPVKHTFTQTIESIERRILPSLEKELRQYFQTASQQSGPTVVLEDTDQPDMRTQLRLPGLELAALKVIPSKTRKKIKKRLSA